MSRLDGSRLGAAAALFAATALVGCGSMPMQKEVLATKAAPEAIGPYSQAIMTGPMVFLAGQIPIDPRNNQLMNNASIVCVPGRKSNVNEKNAG